MVAQRSEEMTTDMTTIGYAAMLEQFHPSDLLDWCAQAEGAGFDAGFMVSEHFHPWTRSRASRRSHGRSWVPSAPPPASDSGRR